MSIKKNIKSLMSSIHDEAVQAGRSFDELTIVAVSKNCTSSQILEAYEVGCRDFGENRAQESLIKIDSLPADIRWHYIGHLQKNKVSKVVGRFSLIHSVDTPELAEKISDMSASLGLKTAILLEVNTSRETKKHGLSSLDWEIRFHEVITQHGVEIAGLMTMAPLTDDQVRIRNCFSELRELRDKLRMNTELPLSILSMGMSNDYKIAIQEGSTMLRIGSAIFNA